MSASGRLSSTRPIAALALAASLAASQALAHHSFFGRFDTSSLTELEGEVVEVLWRNPHVYLTLRVRSDDGTATD